MKRILAAILLIGISSAAFGQANPLGLGFVSMSTSSDILDCGRPNDPPFTPFAINFILVPPGSGSKGARFKVEYDGPEGYLESLLISSYDEELVSYFSCESVFDSVDVGLSQCIFTPRIIFSQEFFIYDSSNYLASLRIGEHPGGGMGVYDCSEDPVLIQTCITEFLINDSDYLINGCNIDCPTTAEKSSTWGAVKSIYRE
jgi:hypothetical protein